MTKKHENKTKEWRTNHHKVMSWLLNSVDATMSAQLAKFDLANEVWDFLRQTHTMKGIAHKWKLQAKLSKLHQGDKTIHDYYGEFSQLWDELSIFEPKWRDPHDILLREKTYSGWQSSTRFPWLCGLNLTLLRLLSSIAILSLPSMRHWLIWSWKKTNWCTVKNNMKVFWFCQDQEIA